MGDSTHYADIVYSRYDTLSFSVAALCECRYKSTWVDLKIRLLLLTRLDPFSLNDSSKSGSPQKNKVICRASSSPTKDKVVLKSPALDKRFFILL
jgi:hypothetical protein